MQKDCGTPFVCAVCELTARGLGGSPAFTQYQSPGVSGEGEGEEIASGLQSHVNAGAPARP